MGKVLEYFSNLWYSLIRIGVLEMENGIMDAKVLGAYIKNKYKNTYGTEISPIKLQKALYFCFAYWGGLIRKSKNNPDYVEENLSKEKEILFDNIIEAWVYGPVVPDVYKEKKLDKFYSKKEDIFNGNIFLENTINSILDDLFEVSDFKLVSISHEDKCWQNEFNIDDIMHNNEIKKETIIKEYANKECL